jgi:hypothetical protein
MNLGKYIFSQITEFIPRHDFNKSVNKYNGNQKIRKLYGRLYQITELNHFYSRKDYPEKLRRIKYYDETTKKHYVYLTNDQELKAETIAELYKNRWQIELFFKWIKQHLKIEIFWGRSMNAIKTQICIAICTFLIIARVKKELKIKRNIHEILQILSVSQFEKVSMKWLLSEENLQKFNHHLSKQALLFDP